MVKPIAQPQSHAGQKINFGARDESITASQPITKRVINNSKSGFIGDTSMISSASHAHMSPKRNPTEILSASEVLSPFAAQSPAHIKATAPVVILKYGAATAHIGGSSAMQKAKVKVSAFFDI